MAELIRQMRAEIEEAKELTAQGKLGEAMALANGKKPRGARRAESRTKYRQWILQEIPSPKIALPYSKKKRHFKSGLP